MQSDFIKKAFPVPYDPGIGIGKQSCLIILVRLHIIKAILRMPKYMLWKYYLKFHWGKIF